MNPHPRHQSLFFTPRTPWGTRLTGRTFHNHMRASEDAPTNPDEQHPLSGKELLGLGGGMAPNQFVGSQGSAAQAGGNGGGGWKVQPYQTSPWIAHNPADMLREKLPEPKDHPLDRTIPQGLSGQIPAPDSGGPLLKAPPFVRPASQSPQPAAGSGVLLRPPTQEEKQNEQTARSGGAQNSIQKPEPESWLEKLPVKPSFDFHKRRLEGVELEKEVPWDKIFRK